MSFTNIIRVGFIVWTGAILASIVLMLRAAGRARSAMPASSPADRLRAIIGLRMRNGGTGDRSALIACWLYFLTFLLLVCLPPRLLPLAEPALAKMALSWDERNEHPDRVGEADMANACRFTFVPLPDDQIGIRIDEVVPGGTLDKLAIRTGDLITAIDGLTWKSAADAYNAVWRLCKGESRQVQLRSSDGTVREIYLRSDVGPLDGRFSRR